MSSAALLFPDLSSSSQRLCPTIRSSCYPHTMLASPSFLCCSWIQYNGFPVCTLDQEEEEMDVRGKSRAWDGDMSDSESEDGEPREPRRRNHDASEPAFARY